MSKFNGENPDQIKICRSKIKYPNQKKAHFKSLEGLYRDNNKFLLQIVWS
jgi:hypothetical protein